MSPTTRITDRGDDIEVELEIPDFLSLYAERYKWVYSDDFDFISNRFCFEISTGTGEMDRNFAISLSRYECESKCSVMLWLGIKKENEQDENVAYISNLTFLRHEIYRAFQFSSFSRDALQQRSSELLPSGVLTLVFILWEGDLPTDSAATDLERTEGLAPDNCISSSLRTGTHPRLLSAEIPPEGAAASPTTVILTNRLVKVEFKIPDFLSIRRGDHYVCSDDCLIMDHRFRFDINARVGDVNKSFPVYICRYRPEAECSVVLKIGIKKEDGQVENMADILNLTFLSREVIRGFRFPSFSRDALQGHRSELLSHGVLTLVFTLQMEDRTAMASTSRELAGSPHHNVEASTQTESEICVEKLSDDLNDLMLSGEESDFTVKVQGEEFRLHRNILGARTPVFRSMLRSEMEEKRTGCVCIDDCEPGTFREFVRYVYTGRVDELSTDTVFGLYTISDKYQVDEVKSACLRFIQGTLSVDTFCDAVTLALTYGLKDLLQQATRYFIQNVTTIVQTVKWMNFMVKNPIQANELHLKAHLRNNSK